MRGWGWVPEDTFGDHPGPGEAPGSDLSPKTISIEANQKVSRPDFVRGGIILEVEPLGWEEGFGVEFSCIRLIDTGG